MKRTSLRLIAAVCIAVIGTGGLVAASGMAKPETGGPKAKGKLAKVKRATARYQRLSVARKAGYHPVGECTEQPGVGAMGYHYGNEKLLADPRLRPRKPEILVYERRGKRMRLVAVEWMRPDADQDLNTDDDRPYLFGRPFDGPMLGHEPEMPIHYDLHAWIWKRNPAGVFAMWNPRVSCP